MANNYRFKEIINQCSHYWLSGISSGQILNGHFGYREIAPESTADLLLVEFERYDGPVMQLQWDAAWRN